MNEVQIGVGEGWVKRGHSGQWADFDAVVRKWEREGYQVATGSFGSVFTRKVGDGAFEPMPSGYPDPLFGPDGKTRRGY